MSLELQQAELSDIDEIAAVLDGAFVEDPIIPQLLPAVELKERVAFWADWLRGDFSRPGEKIFKIVDTSSWKIVAFARCRYPAPAPAHDEEEGEFPKGSNAELLSHWFERMDYFKDKHMDYEKDFFVNVLATLPEYHRKGLGTRLLTPFLDAADKASAKTYIQATESGYGLYLRLGWTDIEDMVTNTPNGPMIWKCMMREPNPLKN